MGADKRKLSDGSVNSRIETPICVEGWEFDGQSMFPKKAMKKRKRGKMKRKNDGK